MKQKTKKSQFITKEYLDARLKLTTETLLNEIDKRHNQVMTSLDGIVKELETIREDRELAVYQTREIREQVEDHEKRLMKVEKLQNPVGH